MKLATISLLSLPLLAACIPAHVDCETDYTVDYRSCHQKETDGPNFAQAINNTPPVSTPSRPVDEKPVEEPDDNGGDSVPDDNGDGTKDHNGGDTKDHSRDDSNGDNSSDDSNGDNSDEKPKRGKHK